MAVRTKRLAAAVSGVGSVVTVYTSPAGETTIIKDIRISANQGGAVTRAVVILASGTSSSAVFDAPLANFETRSATGFIVLQPGEHLQLFATGLPFSVWVSGTQLEGVAD